jgi:hypothetical protein
MKDEWLTKLERTTLTSQMLTHARLKHLANIAQTSEDHISRIGMGLSLRMGAVSDDWQPYELGSNDAPINVFSGKSIRGKTLFKSDLTIFCALILQHQVPENYDGWRQTLGSHWERGVQLLTQRASGESDWLRIISKLPLD